MEGGGLIIDCKTYAMTSVGIDMHFHLCAQLSQLAGVEQGVFDSYAGIVEVMEKEGGRGRGWAARTARVEYRKSQAEISAAANCKTGRVGSFDP